jgi:hypothetical protein
MSPHKSIPMLRIKSCSDPMRWYSNLVGRNVPQLGYDPVSGWKSKEPAGYTNFVLQQDAEGIVSLVPEYLLGRWPYITHDTLAAGTAHAVAKLAATLPPKTFGCCEGMGICQALDHCQFADRINAQLARKGVKPPAPTPTGQSRTHSMAETMANIVVGFAASMVIQALVLPAMGHDITLAQNFWITCIFTVVSVVRGYGIRRIFNRFQARLHQ